MKKYTLLKLFAVLILSACFMLVAFACGETETTTERAVQEIKVISAPTEPYVLGETEIDLSQIIIQVT